MCFLAKVLQNLYLFVFLFKAAFSSKTSLFWKINQYSCRNLPFLCKGRITDEHSGARHCQQHQINTW